MNEGMLIKDCVIKPLFNDLKEIAERSYWKDICNRTFLITGGAGFISSYLVQTILLVNDLYGNNNNVIIMVRNVAKARDKYGNLLDRSDLIILQQDVCQTVALDKCDYIVHAAGGAEASLFEACPVDVFNTNTIGTNNILKAAVKLNTTSVVYLSSYTVYGQLAAEKERLYEDDLGLLDFTKYNACYANGKRAGEMLCQCYLHQYGTPVKIARPGFIYGASSLKDSRVYAEIIRNAMQGTDVILKSSGQLFRTMCYVTDLVRGVFSVLFSGKNGEAYNVANEHVSIREFAEAAHFANKNTNVIFQKKEDALAQKPEKIVGIMDSGKLSALPEAWNPQVSIADGINMAAMIMADMAKKAER